MSWLFNRMEKSAFHDKAWNRAELAAWDARWHRLSLPARRHLLDSVQIGLAPNLSRATNSIAGVTPPVFNELRSAELISLEEAGRPDCFVVAAATTGGLARIRALRRYNLLSDQPSQFDLYVSHAFLTYELNEVVADVVEKQTGISRSRMSGNPFELFVRRQRWPDWVADYLAASRAQAPYARLFRPLLEAIEKAGKPVPLPRLAELLPGAAPEMVRAALDQLVNHLAFFEDLDLQTLDVVVGLLPEVIQARRRARQESPARMEPCQPVETASEAGIEVPDLRSILLEVAGTRPRLRTDGSLYQKDQERFLAALDPLPGWLLSGSEAEVRQQRLQMALRWGHQMEFVQSVKGSDRAVLLDLTPAGQRWLALGREAQYAVLFDELRDAEPSRVYSGPVDGTFLGSTVHSVPAGAKGSQQLNPLWRMMSQDEKRPLREALYALFASLPHGTFFSIDAFINHSSRAPRNPLLLGRPPAETIVQCEQRLVPPLEDFLRDAARMLLGDLLKHRLVGLGCVQPARDRNGHFLIACLPRIDVYFGKRTAPLQGADTPCAAATRVVVQPDFTIVVIGLDPAPMAELAPFCDRLRGSATQGSLTFRLSRASLFRGLAGGLTGDEMLARLRKYASNELPGNVVTEVQTWGGQARTVDVAPATLIHCPDADTAGRVVSALGKQAQRVGDKVVALDTKSITPAMRQKLQAEGIMLGVVKSRK